jgi:ribosomal protein L23
MALLQNANKVTVKVNGLTPTRRRSKKPSSALYQVKVVDVKIINQRAEREDPEAAVSRQRLRLQESGRHPCYEGSAIDLFKE